MEEHGKVYAKLKNDGSAREESPSVRKSAAKTGSELRKLANELLHAPTMQLRKGQLSEIDIESVVKRIEKQLVEYLGDIVS